MFSSMFKVLRRIPKQHYVYLALVLMSMVSTFTFHRAGFIRTLQSVRDLISSVGIWALSLVHVYDIIPETIMSYDFPGMIEYIGFDVDEVVRKLSVLFPTMFTKAVFLSYLVFLANKLEGVSYYLLLLLPLIFLGRILIRAIYLKPQNKDDKRKWIYRFRSAFFRWLYHFDKPVEIEPLPQEQKPKVSKQLEWFLRKPLPMIRSIIAIIREFWDFGRGPWHVILLLIWLVNLNVATIVISAFGVYFYILGTFRLRSLLYQLAKLLVDVIVMFAGASIFFWLIVGYRILTFVRYRIGYKLYRFYESKNRDFIESLPLSSIVTGWMAAGKTALITDFGISYEAILRDKALDMLYSLDLRFPDFPWRNVERMVDFGVAFGFVHSLCGLNAYIEEVRDAYNDKLLRDDCFEYDPQNEKAFSDNGLVEYDIFDAICEYAQLYLIYGLDTSLIMSSYAVRGGLKRKDQGHFPLWDDDFFNRDVFYRVEQSDYMSHVIDYDIFRLGKRLKKDNPNVGVFEFGVVLMSEKGKERGNALENQHFKKDDIRANPKNDLFDLDLKLRRHAGTVGFYCFCKFFSDEQRPESIGANEREVSQVIHVEGVEKEGVYCPFFTLTGALGDRIRVSFRDFHYDYRSVRSDHTLLVYLLKHSVSWFCGYVERYRNLFGYKRMVLKLDDGTKNGILKRYTISKKKLYNGVYSTDCLKGIYAEEILNCKRSLADVPTYDDIVAAPRKLREQNSYFINSILEDRHDDR